MGRTVWQLETCRRGASSGSLSILATLADWLYEPLSPPLPIPHTHTHDQPQNCHATDVNQTSKLGKLAVFACAAGWNKFLRFHLSKTSSLNTITWHVVILWGKILWKICNTSSRFSMCWRLRPIVSLMGLFSMFYLNSTVITPSLGMQLAFLTCTHTYEHTHECTSPEVHTHAHLQSYFSPFTTSPFPWTVHSARCLPSFIWSAFPVWPDGMTNNSSTVTLCQESKEQ